MVKEMLYKFLIHLKLTNFFVVSSLFKINYSNLKSFIDFIGISILKSFTLFN